ncbi:hypothetical protein [Candidatus Poriferisodalis sp.]|uniref:hypothetical protein n=1 Tax=Candidatus Poriferisodalis sp. TaxID=3101277 RepID=UPI003B5B8C07
MSNVQQDLNETADRRSAAGDQPSDCTDPLAPPPASQEEPEPENDEPGRLSRLADKALETAKQTADATISGSRRAAEAASATAASTARVIEESAKTAAAAGASAGRAISDGAEAAVATSASAAKTIGSGSARAGIASGRAVVTGVRRMRDMSIDRSAAVLSAAQSLVASDLAASINDLVAAAVKGSATIYDKAMDAAFIETGIGGSWHRLFDGGHTIPGAFSAAHAASPDDSLIEEALGAVQGLLRDVSTPRGLPLANWDKATFDAVADSLESTFGIPKDWFRELNTYDAGDLLGGAIGVVSVIFGWNRADTETFARLAVGMGISAAVSVNPLLMPVAVIALARAFHKAHFADEYDELAEGMLKGLITSASVLGTVTLVGIAGGSAGVALLAGITAGVLAHVAAKKVTLDAISTFVKEDAAKVIRQIADQACALGDAIGTFLADTGRVAVRRTATAGQAVANSAASVGRFSAEQASAAGRGAVGTAQAAGRLAAGAATATASAVGSAAQRTKALIDRDEPEDAEVDLPDTPDG